MQWLYHNWAKTTLILAVYVSLMLFCFHQSMSLVLLLIWLQFPLYLVHEFEEHVYPGHFKEYINHALFKREDNFPLNDVNIFWINILAIWLLYPLACTGSSLSQLGFGVLLPIFSLFNATLHIIVAIIKKQYNPGLLTSIVLLYPFSIYTLVMMANAQLLNTATLTYAIVIAIAVHDVLVGYAKLRIRKSSKT